MTDLRSQDTTGDTFTSRATDGLAEHICGKVQLWEQKRDVEYRRKWEEFRRIWMGEWAPQDRDRSSERSRALMPATQQAVDSAVSEVEEAIFGQERWFDLPTDRAETQEDEGGPGRLLADQLLRDLEGYKAAVSEIVLLASVYGTGIGKVIVRDGAPGEINLELIDVNPFEFVIDHGAETIQEAEGVAHIFDIPYNVVLERQRQGIYANVDPRIGISQSTDDENAGNTTDALTVRIIEYQGLVPANMLPEVEDDREKLAWEDEKPVEAIVTIANDNVVLRAVQNPMDRGFVAFQWDTVPGRFWGRGIVEKAYWPQKVLDAEVRSRIDALGFSTIPMTAVNAATVPRGANFEARPGRNIFVNGDPRTAIMPMQFPPPDPQTYTQGQEMQRMIEMATGQLQAATPFGVNGRNETASGMSMMLGASIRRTRRTMANIERAFMKPLLAKSIRRLTELDDRYPPLPFEVQIKGTLGMMAREFEAMQLGQLLNAMPPGPSQFMILRAIVENMGLKDRNNILELLDVLTAQALEPAPQRDLSGEARLMSVQLRGQELQIDQQMQEQRLQVEREKMLLEAEKERKNHEREVMNLAIQADKADSADVSATSKAILDLSKAQETAENAEIAELRRVVEDLKAQAAEEPEKPTIDIEAITSQIMQAVKPAEQGPISLERDENGLIKSIDGREVSRNDQGLIVGVA